MHGKTVNNTTKFAPPEEGDVWVKARPIPKMINAKNQNENRILALKLFFDRNHFTKTTSFINSLEGQMQFFSKLEVENEMKSHCIDSCFTENSHLTKNLTQTEKNCLTNCAVDSNVLLEGFRMYNHYRLARGANYEDYQLEKSIPINKI